MAVLSNTMMQGTAADSGEESYQIERSVKFDRASSTDGSYMKKWQVHGGSRRAHTYSFWVKLGQSGVEQYLLMGNSSTGRIKFESDGQLKWEVGSSQRRISNQLFRDHGAFYNFVFVVDTNNQVAADRLRVFVNGERIYSWATEDTITQGLQVEHNHANLKLGANGDSQNTFDGYMADVQFIDGLALDASAFGEYDAAGNWGPKTLARPTPNNGTTWSSTLTGTSGGSSVTVTDPEKAFNTNLSNKATFSHSSGNDSIMTFTAPGDGITGRKVRVYCYQPQGTSGAYQYLSINGGTYVKDLSGWAGVASNADGWSLEQDIPGGVLTSLAIKLVYDGSSSQYIYGIEVDGVLLHDGRTDPTTLSNPNQYIKWQEFLTASDGSVTNAANMDEDHTATFHSGQANTNTIGTDWTKFTPPTPITVEQHINLNFWDGDHQQKVLINETGSWLTPDAVNFAKVPFSGTLTSIKISSNTNARNAGSCSSIGIDDFILAERYRDNSFHLKFDAKADIADLGRNAFNTTIAAATGGLPIYNTDNVNGKTKKSGYRTDSSAGTTDGTGLVFALPGDVLDGDVHHLINTGSSKKTVTVNNTVTVGTEDFVSASGYFNNESQFYRQTLRFDGSSDYLTIAAPGTDFEFGTGDFTVEYWVYYDDTPGNTDYIFDGRSGGGQNSTFTISHDYMSNATGYFGMYQGSSTKMIEVLAPQIEEWVHVAFSRASGTLKLFYNGVCMKSVSDSTNISDVAGTCVIGARHNGDDAHDGSIQDFRVYKGVGKYTSNFTVPSRRDWYPAKFSTQGAIVKTASATGAKPILQTTGDFGGSTDDSVNTDSDASTLLICLSGKSLTEVEPSGRTAATRTWSHNGNSTISTQKSRFYGSSFKFDGVDDYITAGDSTDFDMSNTPWTTECWVNHDNASGWVHLTGQWHVNTFTNCAYALWLDSGKPAILVGSSNNNIETKSNEIIPVNTWAHLAATYDGSYIRLYVNGKLKAATAHTAGVNNGAPDFHLGAALSGSSGSFSRTNDLKGYIQDVRVYKNKVKYTADFTVTNDGISTAEDALNDSPTNYEESDGTIHANFPTLNPLIKRWGNGGTDGDMSNGNLTYNFNTGNTAYIWATQPIPATGKWFWEFTLDSSAADECSMGLIPSDMQWNGYAYYIFRKTGVKRERPIGGSETQTSYGSAYGAGDVIGCAVDQDNQAIYWSVNGTWQASGDPTSGSSQTNAAFVDKDVTGWFPGGYGDTNIVVTYNFGQRPFKYNPPTGYKSLCTQNLDDLFSGDEVNNPSKYFDIKLWTGTGAQHDIKGLNFQPDLVWIKNRDATNGQMLTDAVRGATKVIYSHQNAGQSTESESIKSFLSDGFRLGTFANNNSNGDDYVAWNWDAGTTANGSVDSCSQTVNAQWTNPTAGFSITSWEGGGGAGQTVAHGLGAKPEFFITKRVDGSQDWVAFHKAATAQNMLTLNSGTAMGDSTTAFNDTEPTNTLITYGTESRIGNADTHITYAWTGIPSFSAFGTFEGNGNAVGPFVNCGFRPALVMIKNLDDTDNWHFHDTARVTSNPVTKYLFPNQNNGGYSNDGSTDNRRIDILSNGFKLRDDDYINSSHTFAWGAWAEQPLKTARAR